MQHKVIVIGAGVIGCCLADELTRRGASVTVIDAAEVGSATSAATFAWVNSNNKTPEEYSNLNLLGLQAHERSASRGGGRWFHQTGNVQIAQSNDELEALQHKVEKLASNGYEVRLLTPAQVRELEPSLEAPRLTGGAFYPEEGWIDTLTMCTSLLNRAITGGATFAPYETVTGIQPNQVTTRTTDGTTRKHQADTIILAAGNGTRKILATAGIDFPTLEPSGTGAGKDAKNAGIGIISTTGPIASGMRHIVRATGIAMRPARNGGITFADHPTGGKWDIDDPRIWTVPALLLERARELYPTLKNVSTENVSLGIRVLPEDGLTIADRLADYPSIYAVATHSGVTLSAHLAEAVADEVLDGRRHHSLEAFGLARFETANL
ncbi:FAD-binding oxidoreductase [Pseudarthrobacter oxydans]|uniref:FAD-dependent oxidoreductase n=1 Tax=Pseudarthrobacter oxydans TaxID=1671 RepID=UPI001574E268|nr:FAD-binding oxidoreductase [Pseudarthrobacter oxydans]